MSSVNPDPVQGEPSSIQPKRYEITVEILKGFSPEHEGNCRPKVFKAERTDGSQFQPAGFPLHVHNGDTVAFRSGVGPVWATVIPANGGPSDLFGRNPFLFDRRPEEMRVTVPAPPPGSQYEYKCVLYVVGDGTNDNLADAESPPRIIVDP